MPTEQKPSIISRIQQNLDRLRAKRLATPSTRNIFTVVGEVRKRKLDIQSEVGSDIVIAKKRTFHHEMSQHSWSTNGSKITVRQRLPIPGKDVLYLSTVFSQSEPNSDIHLSTCVTHNVQGEFQRIGDLRMDAFKRKGFVFEEGTVDGPGADLGIPTGEWHIKGQPFENAISRAYKLLLRAVYGVGDVPPLHGKVTHHSLLDK